MAKVIDMLGKTKLNEHITLGGLRLHLDRGGYDGYAETTEVRLRGHVRMPRSFRFAKSNPLGQGSTHPTGRRLMRTHHYANGQRAETPSVASVGGECLLLVGKLR